LDPQRLPERCQRAQRGDLRAGGLHAGAAGRQRAAARRPQIADHALPVQHGLQAGAGRRLRAEVRG
jgi:hypothetical protein